MRLQLALNVKSLEPAIEFYSNMFGVVPNKIKSGYANFAINNPPLKLVLFENPDATDRINHLGVETFEEQDVTDATSRFVEADLPVDIEREIHCCHAISNKVWVRETDGIRWEWYRVLADIEETPKEEACCPS